jgi:hypothetical protein
MVFGPRSSLKECGLLDQVQFLVDRETDRQMRHRDRLSYGQTGRQTDKQTNRERQTGCQMDRQIDRQTNRERQTNCKMNGKADSNTFRHGIKLVRKKVFGSNPNTTYCRQSLIIF